VVVLDEFGMEENARGKVLVRLPTASEMKAVVIGSEFLIYLIERIEKLLMS
jgi:hypothetical protein